MRIPLAILALLAAQPCTAQPFASEPRLPATLAGRATLAADATVPPPPDTPPGFAQAGRWANPDRLRADRPGLTEATAGPAEAPRPTGLRLPLQGQPAGAIAALAAGPDGTLWALGDGGFGTRASSPDVLLRRLRLRPDPATGTVTIAATTFLADPNRAVPFHIVTDPSPNRYLTGADLQPAGLVTLPDGSFWVADRAGPALLEFDAAGRLRDGFPVTRLGVTLRGAEPPAFAPPPPPGTDAVQPDGGLAGLAATPDGRSLWAAFARPLRDASAEGIETDTVRILEFDLATRDWTGREAAIELPAPDLSIAGLMLLDDRRALFLEQDGGEGDARLGCDRRRPPACFPNPARHKRLVLVDLGALDTEGYAKRLAHVDLLDIADPDGVAQTHSGGGPGGRFALPLARLTGLAPAGPDRLVLVNHSGVGRHAGRDPLRADATEFVLLLVPELLGAR